jgi:Bacterial regulatory proteins, gntR family.
LAENVEGETVKKLPPIRKLARELGVNNGTVARAYEKLEENGIVYTKTGSGTYLRRKAAFQNYLPYINRVIEKNKVGRDPQEESVDFIDLASSTPSPDFFPCGEF